MGLNTDMKVLVTGAAGFIGFHLVIKLLNLNFEVVGLDNINNYYDPKVKYGRLKELGIICEDNELISNELTQSSNFPLFKFVKLELEDNYNLNNLFQLENFDYVCNLAAQAGVRYSLTNPEAYIKSNIVGFLNIIEACRFNKIKHLIYASSSSVYGLNKNLPFSTKDNVDHPISLYAASKKSNELMAHTYSHLYDIPTTGLRFFTVYGPWGRPDMALFLFTKAILNNQPIDVFNNGEMMRDFTYVDDIVEAISRLLPKPPKQNLEWNSLNPHANESSAPYRVYNIGNNKPVRLLDFIKAIENKLECKAIINFLPLQPGDVPETYADVEDLVRDINYKPETTIKQGIDKFVDWYLDFYKINN